MKKVRGYRQCVLVRDNVQQVTHLPEEVAFCKTVIMREDNTEWEVRKFGHFVSAEIAEARAHAWGDIWKPSSSITSRGKK